MISKNVQVILVADRTKQGNNRIEKISQYACLNHHWFSYLLQCGKKAVRVLSFPVLPPHINSPFSWEKRKTGQVGKYHFFPLVCRLALVISTVLQFLMNVDSGKQRFPDGGSSMISGFIELTANRSDVHSTRQSVFGSSQMLSSRNAF